jgi:hypothetical protein
MGQTAEQIRAELRALEKTATWNGYTIETLRTAFEAVQNAEHWKGPIDAAVTQDSVAGTYWSIVFYTATSPDIKIQDDGLFRITSEGYWAGRSLDQNGPAHQSAGLSLKRLPRARRSGRPRRQEGVR